ncbi:hypothetical protein R3I93_016831 [Phoxinus phoxinus]|uniref:Immunoglobulin domain-containing protein n=1 Tax=Phoxinus phoxinus TaxID=58324 RepID=A0AAN9CH20_9TELE
MFLPVLLCLCFWRLDGVFGDEVKSVSVMAGDSVSLNSGLTEIQKDDLITWTFGSNGHLIAKTDGVNNIIPDNLDERFRDRLKLDKKTGSLTVMNIRTEDAGVYEVEISGRSSSSTHRFTVTVYGSPSGPPLSPPPAPVSLIVPISFAAAAGSLMIAAVFGMFWICRKCRDEDLNHDQTDATLYKHFGQMKDSEMTEVIYTYFSTEQSSNSL